MSGMKLWNNQTGQANGNGNGNTNPSNPAAVPVQQPTANYTLPGVINYLTSEFTSLERFKIMTNLEKSEMKYRITELQGEVNTLRYLNEQQKLRISQLEKENRSLRGEPTAEESGEPIAQDIPQIDLDVIKDLRYQLTKSMREVIHLLRNPINANLDYLEIPDVNETTNSFEQLLNDKFDSFEFNGYKDEKSTIAKYFNDDADTVVLDDDHLTGELEPTIDDSPLKLAGFSESQIPVESKVRVFNSPTGNVLLYISQQDDTVDVFLYDVVKHEQVGKYTSTIKIIEKMEEIQDIYLISHSEETVTFLAIYSEEVVQITVDGEDSLVTIVASLEKITGSKLTNFDNGSEKAFGLALVSNGVLKIYDIKVGPRNSIISTEIGSYNKNFFKDIDSAESAQLQIIKWFKSTETPKKTASVENSAYLPYQLVVKLGLDIFVFNIATKHYNPVTDNSETDFALEANNSALVLKNKVDDDSFQLEIHSFQASHYNRINVQDKSDEGVFSFLKGLYIFKLLEHKLQLYDKSLVLLSTLPVSYEKAYRVGDALVLQGDALKVYTVSTDAST